MEQFAKLPIWQRIVLFVVVGALVVAGWFFLLYQDAVGAHDAAKQGVLKADAELTRVSNEQKNFLERQRKQAEIEAQLQQKVAVLPTSKSSLDNLMQTFQQQARLVGLTVESWTPEPEQKEDFYARLPVKVRATGTWTQAGEFFRRMYELGRENKGRIVSVDQLVLTNKSAGKAEAGEGAPMLEISFEAATYRFLTEAERSAVDPKKKSRRRKK
ncbi:MAG: type 4a pilus biogenesis protein PilO [Nannocystaceae bacterium]|nr:type 4a pilus biogenesis protein PilO [Nannocystaceae bacterium]